MAIDDEVVALVPAPTACCFHRLGAKSPAQMVYESLARVRGIDRVLTATPFADEAAAVSPLGGEVLSLSAGACSDPVLIREASLARLAAGMSAARRKRLTLVVEVPAWLPFSPASKIEEMLQRARQQATTAFLALHGPQVEGEMRRSVMTGALAYQAKGAERLANSVRDYVQVGWLAAADVRDPEVRRLAVELVSSGAA